MKMFRRRVVLALFLSAGMAGMIPRGNAAPDFVWIEGESPTALNFQPKPEGVGHPDFLSAGAWLKLSVEARRVEQETPAAGVVARYTFAAPQTAAYELWMRLGYEFVRSPCEWRLDQGEWHPVGAEALTTDLMELSYWTEVAWLKLGQQPLAAGPHTFTLRVPRTKDDQGKFRRLLFALDALCFSARPFQPYSHFQPGQDHQTDRDRQAARQVFELPPPAAPGQRVAVSLAGLWEVCRHDELLPGPVAAPIPELPSSPRWTAIEVPGDKNARADLVFAHRLWYRTRVNVPNALAGRSFFLVFPQNNLNTTVYVNGQYCGFDKNPFARVQIDVTKAIHRGRNEIQVGVRDAWYGFSANTNRPLKLRKKFNLPKKYFSEGFQDLAYPIWNHPQSGILVTPKLVAAGRIYASDVFVKPSVADQRLDVQITVANNLPTRGKFKLAWEVVTTNGQPVWRSPAEEYSYVPMQHERSMGLSRLWKEARRWWPNDPYLYVLRTIISRDGQVADVSETRFGFREWSVRGRDFLLNGIPFHGWADCFRASSKEDWLRFYQAKHQTVMRFWGTSWQGLPPDAALDFFDAHGVVCRRSGLLDGERIGYMAIEKDAELKRRYGSDIKMELMHNWRDQILAQVKGERNHPSIMLWSLENEWLYINCINLYRNKMDAFESAVIQVSDAVRQADPTRPTMVDGGGATQRNALPVHGDHYVWDKTMTRYPDLAYQPNPTGGGRGRWEWDQQRPRFLGEDYYIAGHHPELAYLGGEAVFTGKAGSLPAAGLMARMLTEGYRWAGFGAFHFWMSQTDTDQSHYQSFAPRAVFCRQWDWTFGAGQSVPRTLGIFNDTHADTPLTLVWTLMFDGKTFATDTQTYAVAPGTNRKFDVTLQMPKVQARTEGEWRLALSVNGKEVYRDTKAISVLPPATVGAATVSVPVAVYDPQGSAATFLRSQGQRFAILKDLSTPPIDTKVLVIGKDALTPQVSTTSALAALAAAGRAVIVLEQTHPLKYQALPCVMDAARNEGRVAFAEDLEHPALRGLRQKDFFTWGPDAVVYRDAYRKPTRGAKSLVQCDDRLQYSALVEVPCGRGILLLSQLCLGEKLASHAVAQQVFLGLLHYAAGYRQEFRPVAACVQDAPQLAAALQATGLKYTEAGDPLAALTAGQIAVVAATPAHLKTLSAHRDQVAAFNQQGGWIVLNGLTPAGLADYNRLVGWQHMIRPFRRERVTFPPVKNRLTAGLTAGDVALYSNERIFPWQAGTYVADDTFSYVVDYDEVAPFAQFPSDYFHNMVNGMVSADGWKYIFSFELKRGDRPEWTMTFPQQQDFTEFTWIGNGFYHLVTKVEIAFDDRDTMSFTTAPNTEPQTFTIDPPRPAKTLRLRLADWQRVPNKNDVVGVDNLYLKARRPPEFYTRVKPMLNIGALMEYPRGPGGLVLCNVRFQETEAVPANGPKKRAILATILRNLKAPFAGKTIIAGANLRYTPIDLSHQANAYRDAQGWFGDRRFTFKDLPTGRQTFAGVDYEIFDFPTSPVPTALMLSEHAAKPAREIRGIPVGRKADALFFLHTMKLEHRRNRNDERRGKQYETLRYLVHYADGQTASIPILAEVDIDDYRRKQPQAIPGAQIAWTHPYPGTDYTAVAYSKQWNNPRPDVGIATVDMVMGPDRRGVPVLLALTAASAD